MPEDKIDGPIKLRSTTTMATTHLGGILFAVAFISGTISNDYLAPILAHLEVQPAEIEEIRGQLGTVLQTLEEYGRRTAYLEEGSDQGGGRMGDFRRQAYANHIQSADERSDNIENRAGIVEARVRHLENELDKLVLRVR